MVAPSGLAITTSPGAVFSGFSRTIRMKETASRTWRYGIEESPLPPRRLRFHAFESHVSKNMKRGGYSHQSENIAAKRMITEGKELRYSSSIVSPIRLVRA